MSFKILYVTATSAEAEALRKVRGMVTEHDMFRFGKCEISILITGVGSIATAWSMNHWLSSGEKPDLIINGGIAGSYKEDFLIGEVVFPFKDCFADSGIEDGDNFLTLFENGLSDGDEFPFRQGYLYADSYYCNKLSKNFKPACAITVNTSTGSEATRKKLIKKFNPDIETMEGATFFYICIRERIPFFSLRAISNRVERRNKENWNIPYAIDNLSEKLNEVLKTFD